MTQTPTPAEAVLSSVDSITEALAAVGYVCDRSVANAVYLAHHLRKPVLIEGPAGVGKTELAVSMAKALGQPLIRLQCYEGLDESRALYEWQYGKQLLYAQILKDKLGQMMAGAETLQQSYERLTGVQDLIFSRDFLQPRPLLQAMEQPGGSVLLVDEIDKSEESFEALLLELLADYQVTVPEIGTIRAKVPPLVMLTSNNVRELGDALKRRCLHLHIDFPEPAFERRVLRSRVPGLEEKLLHQLVHFVQSLREQKIRKPPSISESVDWARALLLMHSPALDETLVRDTLNVLLKRQSDVQAVQPGLKALTAEALAAHPA